MASGSIVMRDVPPDSIVVGVPGRVIYREGKRVEEKAPDIEAEALKSMKMRIDDLERRLESVAAGSTVSPLSQLIASGANGAESHSVTSQAEGLEDPVEVFLHGAGI